jgi:Uma2 family endonuclease
MRSRKRLSPKRDPVPELVVEVDLSSPSVPREPIYAALGVPEIWRWNNRRLDCLQLTDGQYRERQKSLAFPFLTTADLTRFIRMRATQDDDNEILRKFRDWVRANGSM